MTHRPRRQVEDALEQLGQSVAAHSRLLEGDERRRRSRPPGRPARAPRRPPRRCGALMAFVIFMASSLTTSCPAATRSPAATCTETTVPGMGAVSSARKPSSGRWGSAARAGGAALTSGRESLGGGRAEGRGGGRRRVVVLGRGGRDLGADHRLGHVVGGGEADRELLPADLDVEGVAGGLLHVDDVGLPAHLHGVAPHTYLPPGAQLRFCRVRPLATQRLGRVPGWWLRMAGAACLRRTRMCARTAIMIAARSAGSGPCAAGRDLRVPASFRLPAPLPSAGRAARDRR